MLDYMLFELIFKKWKLDNIPIKVIPIVCSI